MMKSAYVRIQDSLINKPREEEMQGVKVTVMLSPFDVPESIICTEDENTKALHFKFKYLAGDEPSHTVESTDNSNVRLVLGDRSNRVYEIILESYGAAEENRASINQLPQRVENILSDYVSRNPDKKSGSFDAVKNVLNNYEDRLVSFAQASG